MEEMLFYRLGEVYCIDNEQRTNTISHKYFAFICNALLKISTILSKSLHFDFIFFLNAVWKIILT